MDAAPVGLLEGDSVFTVTEYVLREHGIAFDFQRIPSAYVKGIAGLYEFDRGPASGWLYRINGSFSEAGKSSSEYIVADGDRIEWIYTEDGTAAITD